MRQSRGGTKGLFDGDVTETESDSDTSTKPPDTVSSHVSTSRKSPGKQANVSPRASRASRNLKPVKYAETSSDEEVQEPNRTYGTKKRKRGGSFHDSPTKKQKITNDENKRVRSISFGELFPGTSQKTASPHKPAPSNTTSPVKGDLGLFKLLGDFSPTPLSGKPVFIRLSADGTASPRQDDDQAYWWPGKVCP
jgi:hypothetical protein